MLAWLFLRHASAGGGIWHSHGAGFVGARGCFDDADLYACDAEAGDWRAQSFG